MDRLQTMVILVCQSGIKESEIIFFILIVNTLPKQTFGIILCTYRIIIYYIILPMCIMVVKL